MFYSQTSQIWTITLDESVAYIMQKLQEPSQHIHVQRLRLTPIESLSSGISFAEICLCMCQTAASTILCRATEKAPTREPNCRRSLVPNAKRCSTSDSASTSCIRTGAGMLILKTHLHIYHYGMQAAEPPV